MAGIAFGAIILVAVVVLFAAMPLFPVGPDSFVELDRVSRPDSVDQRAVLYRVADGQGAVGATWTRVYFASGADSIPGKSARLLWKGKRIDPDGIRWRDSGHLEVRVQDTESLRRYSKTIHVSSQPGLSVETVVVADSAHSNKLIP